MAPRDPLDKLRTAADPVQGACRALARTFYDRPVETVAPDLLGRLLCRSTPQGTRIGRIVEVEAYLGLGDLAAHTSRGRTARTRAMFGPPGHAYVYLIYGMYHCMNVVTGPEGSGTAVLLRALAPLDGVQRATHGPGRLCRAMDVTLDQYGADLCGDALWLAEDDAARNFTVATSPRIGVDYAGEWADKPLRFYIQGHPAVSKMPKRKRPEISQDVPEPSSGKRAGKASFPAKKT